MYSTLEYVDLFSSSFAVSSYLIIAWINPSFNGFVRSPKNTSFVSRFMAPTALLLAPPTNE